MHNTFVYEGTEVVKTGRVAERDVLTPNGKKLKTMELVEIKPVDDSNDWKKWVDPKLLFTVK